MVLTALKDHLMEPQLVAAFCEEYTRHMNTLRMQHNAALEGYKAELVKLERERQKLVQAIMEGVPGHAVKDDFERIANHKIEVQALLDST